MKFNLRIIVLIAVVLGIGCKSKATALVNSEQSRSLENKFQQQLKMQATNKQNENLNPVKQYFLKEAQYAVEALNTCNHTNFHVSSGPQVWGTKEIVSHLSGSDSKSNDEIFEFFYAGGYYFSRSDGAVCRRDPAFSNFHLRCIWNGQMVADVYGAAPSMPWSFLSRSQAQRCFDEHLKIPEPLGEF